MSLATLPASPDTPLLYCGEQYDEDLAMYNLRARFYNPSNGRFCQRDTFEASNFDPQSLHKYTYANCDPVNGLDPSGEFTLTEILVTSAIVGIVAGLVTWRITGSVTKALYVGLTAALLTAAIMLLLPYLPTIVHWVRTTVTNMWRYQQAHSTLSKKLYEKLIKEIGEGASVEQRLLWMAANPGRGWFAEMMMGYGRQIFGLLTGRVGLGAFGKWLMPTPAGAVGFGVIVAVLVYIYRENIKELFDDIAESKKEE